MLFYFIINNKSNNCLTIICLLLNVSKFKSIKYKFITKFIIKTIFYLFNKNILSKKYINVFYNLFKNQNIVLTKERRKHFNSITKLFNNCQFSLNNKCFSNEEKIIFLTKQQSNNENNNLLVDCIYAYGRRRMPI